MNSDPGATRPHVPPPALRGYSGPLVNQPPHSDYLHHPLHRVYRRRMRGSRVLWFTFGMVFGGVLAFVLILVLSALVYTRIPKVIQESAGDPDVSVVITEDYINREIDKRLISGFDLGNPNLAFLGARMEITGENRLDYQANFHLNVPFFSTNISAFIKNQVSVQDGELVVNMVGDPQLGNLSLPLDALPFNLKDAVRGAVDRVNNDILVAEMNKTFKASLTGTDFYLDSVATDERNIYLRLKTKAAGGE